MEQVGVRFKLEFEGTDKLNAEMNKLGVNTDDAASSTGNLSNQFALGAIKAQLIMAAVELAGKAVHAYTQFLKESIASAVESEQVNRAFLSVFKDYAGEASDELARLAINAGYSENALRAMAVGVQDFLVPMGVAREEAAEMSTTMLGVATDLAAFRGASIEEVMSAMKSGLAGMSRPMLQYGVDLRAAAVEQELLNMGLVGGAAAASESEMAQARLNLIIRQTADAQGAAVKSMSSSDGLLRTWDARWKDLQDTVGQEFMPVIEKLFPMLLDGLEDVSPGLIEMTEGFAELAEAVGPDLISGFMDAIYFLFEFIKVGTDIVAVVVDLGTAFQNMPEWVQYAINPLTFYTDKIFELIAAMREVEKEVDEAAQNTAFAQHISTASAYIYAMEQQINLTVPELEAMRAAILSLNQDLPEVQEALLLVETRINGVRDASGNFIKPLDEVTSKVGHYSREQIVAALNTSMMTLAVLESTTAMKGQQGALDTQIARTRAWIIELKNALREVGNVTTAVSSGVGSSRTEESTFDRGNFRGMMDGREDIRQIVADAEEAEADRLNRIEEVRRAKKEEEHQHRLNEELKLQQQMQDLAMDFTEDAVGIFVDGWSNGFKDLDKRFGKMLESWVKKMVMSGILDLLGNIVAPGSGKAASGTFGKLLK